MSSNISNPIQNTRFLFQDIANTSPVLANVSLLQLATNIITDWMPGTPDTLATGFADLLSQLLVIPPNSIWEVNRNMASFEKQWKQVSSWILGIGFCRTIIERQGYPWWAPVSAFTSPPNPLTINANNGFLTSIYYFAPPLPGTPFPSFTSSYFLTHCHITKPTPPLSTLLPDYVIARVNNNNCEISFAESKGTKNYLPSLNQPLDWINQSRNAEFFFRNSQLPITQYLLIATRINPNAIRSLTRQIYVRAWNSYKLQASINFDVILDIISLNYIGVCQRIGLESLATWIIYANNIRKNAVKPEKDIRDNLEISLEDIFENSIHQKVEHLDNETIIFSKDRGYFHIGKHTLIRIGLSITTCNLIKELLFIDNVEQFLEIYNKFNKRIIELQSLVGHSSNFSVRLDGTVSLTINRN